MNGWDLFTWICSLSLGAGAVVIFVFFARDARSVLSRDMHHEDESEDTGASD